LPTRPFGCYAQLNPGPFIACNLIHFEFSVEWSNGAKNGCQCRSQNSDKVPVFLIFLSPSPKYFEREFSLKQGLTFPLDAYQIDPAKGKFFRANCYILLSSDTPHRFIVGDAWPKGLQHQHRCLLSRSTEDSVRSGARHRTSDCFVKRSCV